MVMITLDIPQQINKEIEHFKIEHEIKDKRDAIVLLLKQCIIKEDLIKMKRNLYNQGINQFRKLFRKADETKKHNLTPKQIEAMDGDIYD